MGAHIYRTTGHLTGVIEAENRTAAQNYLRQYDMAQFLDEPLKSVTVRIEWTLDHNGHDYKVEAITDRALTDGELTALASWVSGQNSDGLGEGFEQQPFAETEEEGEEDEFGDYDTEYLMISFDWKTNDSKFVEVR